MPLGCYRASQIIASLEGDQQKLISEAVAAERERICVYLEKRADTLKNKDLIVHANRLRAIAAEIRARGTEKA